MDWRSLFRLWPSPNDTEAVARMTAAQWKGISKRTPTYLRNYVDRPGSSDRAQRRAAWIADLPVFDGATSVLEVGCGAGRNLAALKRAHPSLITWGLDINPEGLAAARTAVPSGLFIERDMYDDAALPKVDVVLTVGVLIHVVPAKLAAIVARLAAAAQRGVVFVEQVEPDGPPRVVKGPRQWNAGKATGDYCLWSVSLDTLVRVLATKVTYRRLPDDLQSVGATHVVGATVRTP